VRAWWSDHWLDVLVGLTAAGIVVLVATAR